MGKLGKEERVTLRVLHEKGMSHSEIARHLEVTEGAIRYHIQKKERPDGRQKDSLIQLLGLEEFIRWWWEQHVSGPEVTRPTSLKTLFNHLVCEFNYPGSYKSVRTYARKTFPRPKIRARRRVETPPGAQSQSDWGEFMIDIGDPGGPTKLYAFVMVLSHCRRRVVIWSRRCDQLSWHQVHNEAFRRLGGVAAVNRIDNLKTGMAIGAGPWGKVNSQYRRYAQQMRFHVDATEPRCPEQKGKVERSVEVMRGLGPDKHFHEGLDALQNWTDLELERQDRRRICPPTGKTVWDTWQEEQAFLGPLPENLPEPFDLVRTCVVNHDATIRFDGRTLSVPFPLIGKEVEARRCAACIQIVDLQNGYIVQTWARDGKGRLLIDQACYEGESTAEVLAPKPLGRMGKRLMELAAMPVEQRPVDLYAALTEVAR
ncbi:MAG: IS21 family transposase [Acidobacteriota bacterium]